MNNYKTELTGIVLLIVVCVLFGCIWEKPNIMGILMGAVGATFGVGVVMKAKRGLYAGDPGKKGKAKR